MKSHRRAVPGGGTRWHKFALGAALWSAACGGSAFFGDDDDGVGTTTGTACCEAACVPRIGTFRLLSNGQPVSVDARVVILELGLGAVLYDGPITGSTIEAFPDESQLARYEGQTIQVEVTVEAIGYAKRSSTFSLRVERTEICCSSCMTAEGSGDIELGAPGVLVSSCGTVGRFCPPTFPSDLQSCGGEGACCNYQTPDGMVGCVCATDGWQCQAGACGCL